MAKPFTGKTPGQFEIVILFTAFIAATYGFGIYLFPAIVESVRAGIGFTYSDFGEISGLSQAGFLAASLAAGFLTLRVGAVNLILASVVLCALALAALSLAGSFWTLALPIAVLGICASSVWVPMVEVARSMIAASHRGKALGLMSSGTSYGVFINSGLLAFVLPVYGWRVIWVVCAATVAALALYAAFRLAGLRAQDSPERSASTEPPVRVRDIPRRLMATVLVMMAFNGLAYIPFQYYLSAYLIGEMGHGEGLAASVWGGIGLSGMFSGFLMGALADRITIRRGMIVTHILLVAAVIGLMAGDIIGAPAIWFSAIAFGFSFYPVFGLVPAYISHVFGKGQAALVFAFGSAALGLGGIAGNLVGGIIRDGIGSFDGLYMIVALTAACALVCAVILPSEREA